MCPKAVAQSYPRVETAAALAQLVKRVDPVVPPEAAAKRIGGIVIADVLIGASGTVSGVTILDGHPLLHTAATAAIRRWTFKPFLRGGKPSPVQVILEVGFPDPIAEDARAIYTAHENAWHECRRQHEINPRGAEVACAEAVRTSEQLPSDRQLERSHSRSSHAMALMALGRARDALAEIEMAIKVRTAAAASPDADTADLYQVAAFLHQEVGEPGKAEEFYERAIKEYTGAIQLSAERSRYYPRLKAALRKYASFKKASGDTALAANLERHAAELPTGEVRTDVEAPPKPPRVVSGVELYENEGGRLTDQDVQTILSLTGTARGQVRYVYVDAFGSSGGSDRMAEVLLEPRAVRNDMRRGRRIAVATGSEQTTTAGAWKVLPATSEYIQLRMGDARSFAWSTPIRVQAAPNRPPMEDDELAKLAGFLHAKSRSTVTGQRLLSGVQPWPLTLISATSVDTAWVVLEEPGRRGRQNIDLKYDGREWTVLRIY